MSFAPSLENDSENNQSDEDTVEECVDTEGSENSYETVEKKISEINKSFSQTPDKDSNQSHLTDNQFDDDSVMYFMMNEEVVLPEVLRTNCLTKEDMFMKALMPRMEDVYKRQISKNQTINYEFNESSSSSEEEIEIIVKPKTVKQAHVVTTWKDGISSADISGTLFGTGINKKFNDESQGDIKDNNDCSMEKKETEEKQVMENTKIVEHTKKYIIAEKHSKINPVKWSNNVEIKNAKNLDFKLFEINSNSSNESGTNVVKKQKGQIKKNSEAKTTTENISNHERKMNRKNPSTNNHKNIDDHKRNINKLCDQNFSCQSESNKDIHDNAQKRKKLSRRNNLNIIPTNVKLLYPNQKYENKKDSTKNKLKSSRNKNLSSRACLDQEKVEMERQSDSLIIINNKEENEIKNSFENCLTIQGQETPKIIEFNKNHLNTTKEINTYQETKLNTADCVPLPSRLERRRKHWIQNCLTWSQISTQMKPVQKKSRKKQTELVHLPILSKQAILQAARARSLDQVKLLQLYDLPAYRLNIFSKCSQLEVLSLSNSGLVNIDILEKCTNLHFLDLQNNKINWIHLEGLQKLRILNVSYNQLSVIQSLHGCGNILELDLSHNKITKLSGLDSLRQLVILNLSHNQLISTRGINDVPTIVYLDLSYNHLSSLDDLDECCLLHDLQLEGNSLLKIPIFTNQILLQKLVLDNNLISSIENLTDSWLPCLQILSIINNSLSLLCSLEDCLNLKFLNLSHNCISDINEVIKAVSKNRKLESLNFSENPIDLNPDYFQLISECLPLLRSLNDKDTGNSYEEHQVSSSFEIMCHHQGRFQNDNYINHQKELRKIMSKKPLNLLQLYSLKKTFARQTLKFLVDQRLVHEQDKIILLTTGEKFADGKILTLDEFSSTVSRNLSRDDIEIKAENLHATQIEDLVSDSQLNSDKKILTLVDFDRTISRNLYLDDREIKSESLYASQLGNHVADHQQNINKDILTLDELDRTASSNFYLDDREIKSQNFYARQLEDHIAENQRNIDEEILTLDELDRTTSSNFYLDDRGIKSQNFYARQLEDHIDDNQQNIDEEILTLNEFDRTISRNFYVDDMDIKTENLNASQLEDHVTDLQRNIDKEILTFDEFERTISKNVYLDKMDIIKNLHASQLEENFVDQQMKIDIKVKEVSNSSNEINMADLEHFRDIDETIIFYHAAKTIQLWWRKLLSQKKNIPILQMTKNTLSIANFFENNDDLRIDSRVSNEVPTSNNNIDVSEILSKEVLLVPEKNDDYNPDKKPSFSHNKHCWKKTKIQKEGTLRDEKTSDLRMKRSKKLQSKPSKKKGHPTNSCEEVINTEINTLRKSDTKQEDYSVLGSKKTLSKLEENIFFSSCSLPGIGKDTSLILSSPVNYSHKNSLRSSQISSKEFLQKGDELHLPSIGNISPSETQSKLMSKIISTKPARWMP